MTKSDLTCRPCAFQRGDKVKYPHGVGIVTAVGMQLNKPVYRIGKRLYWHPWQLKLLARGETQ